MISLSEVVNDPDFAQPFSIQRSSGGAFASNGVWEDSKTTVLMYGIVQPATAKELLQVPEGDRAKEVKSFHSSAPMYETTTNGLVDAGAITSDIAIWKGLQYRIQKVYQWEDFGYYKALGVRMLGQ